jgi:hypothetical protein
MKSTLRIWLILGILTAVSLAQQPQPRLHPHKAHPKTAISTTAPIQSHAAQHSPAGNAKPGSVDDQLNKLERDTAKTVAAKPASQNKKAAVAAPLPKANDNATPHKAANFRYQEPTGGVKTNQPQQAQTGRKSGLRRRIDSGPK